MASRFISIREVRVILEKSTADNHYSLAESDLHTM